MSLTRGCALPIIVFVALSAPSPSAASAQAVNVGGSIRLRPTEVGPPAQALDLRTGDRVMASLSDPSAAPLEGSVTDVWEGGLSIRTRGQSTARRVDLGDLSSLQRSRRLGGRAQKGALIVGGGFALAGYGLVCGLSNSSGGGCSGDEANALKVGLILGVPGALLGAGIGALIGHYGPFEPVNLDGSARRSNASRFRMQVTPGETGGVGVRLAMSVGGGR